MSTMKIVDVTEATFEAEVLQRSFEKPVVVDFWAEWCAPCRALGPVLEKLAAEEDADWFLAKVDIETNQRLAGAFSIQSIPAVKAFRDGRPVAEFTGALPEAQVRRWLAGLGPSEGEIALVTAEELETAGDLGAAAEAYERALAAEPGLFAAKSGLARVHLATRTRDLDADALAARAQGDPADVEAALGLADLDAAAGQHELAFQRLVETVRLTSGDERERARVHLLGLLDTLAPSDPRSLSARRDLSMALF